MRVLWREEFKIAGSYYRIRFVGGRLMEYWDLDMEGEFPIGLTSNQRDHIEWALGKYRELRLAAGLSLLPVVVEACMTKRSDPLYEIGVEW